MTKSITKGGARTRVLPEIVDLGGVTGTEPFEIVTVVATVLEGASDDADDRVTD